MITYRFITTRSNVTELKIRSMISQLPGCCSSIESAFRYFNSELENMPRINVGKASDWYKAVVLAPKSFEIWHLNATGEKDRVVALVTES